MKILQYPDKLIRRTAENALGQHGSGKQCVAMLKGMDAAEKAFGSIVWRNVMLPGLDKPDPLEQEVCTTYETEVATTIAKTLRGYEIVATLAAAAVKELTDLQKANPTSRPVKAALEFTKAAVVAAKTAGKTLTAAVTADRKAIDAKIKADDKKQQKENKAALKGDTTDLPLKKVEMADVLRDDKLFVCFGRYCKSEWSGENAEFIWRTRGRVDGKTAIALHDEFINKDAAKALNIDDKLRVEMEQAIASQTYAPVLKKIRLEVLRTLTDAYNRFRMLPRSELKTFGFSGK